MYSNFGAMAELVATVVLKLNGLISELSNGYYMVDLQIKLYGEMSKIKASVTQKYMVGLECWPQNMIC